VPLGAILERMAKWKEQTYTELQSKEPLAKL
jgi:hypothetical protein